MLRKVKSLEELKKISHYDTSEGILYNKDIDDSDTFIIDGMSEYCGRVIDLEANGYNLTDNETIDWHFDEWMLEPIAVEHFTMETTDIPHITLIQDPDKPCLKIHDDGTPELLVSYEDALKQFESIPSLNVYLPVLMLAKKYLDLVDSVKDI